MYDSTVTWRLIIKAIYNASSFTTTSIFLQSIHIQQKSLPEKFILLCLLILILMEIKKAQRIREWWMSWQGVWYIFSCIFDCCFLLFWSWFYYTVMMCVLHKAWLFKEDMWVKYKFDYFKMSADFKFKLKLFHHLLK